MVIRFKCGCGRWLRAEPDQVGVATTCVSCGAAVLVPGPAVEPPLVATADVPMVTAASPPAGELPPMARSDDADRYDQPGPRDRIPASTSGLAIASLICGGASLFLLGLPGIIAVALGIVALVQIARSRGRLEGRLLAWFGMGLGLVMTGLGAGFLYFFLSPWKDGAAFAANREARTAKLELLGRAIESHQRNHGHFPPANICDDKGKPILSWRVAILPELSEGGLFRQFKLDEPWDGPNNRRLIEEMPDVFAIPRHEQLRNGLTHYQMIVGGEAWFYRERLVSLDDLKRGPGPASVVAVVEAEEAVAWTRPTDLDYDPNAPLPSFGGVNPLDTHFMVLAFDGQVHLVRKNADLDPLRAGFERNAKQVIDWNGLK